MDTRAVGRTTNGPRPAALDWVSPATLPQPLTSLIGREREVAEATALLDRGDVRLLTLMGPGGVGKTRLAIALAAELAGAYAHGVCFVRLAPVRTLELVAPAIALALGIRQSGDRPIADAVVNLLHDRHLLLVLDNLEQIPGAAPWLRHVLETCPRLRVVATSRVALRISGEQRFLVVPLDVPAERDRLTPAQLGDYAAVDLFVQRAKAVRPEFALSEANAQAVAAICRRLDGLPLALELAAARSNVFAPEALATWLERRLPLLTGGPRDQPVRLQTMRDAVAWSYDLLSTEEQALLRWLSVFPGGFTLEAAEAIGATLGQTPGEVMELVAALIDQSLLRSGPGEGRFSMLETIREFGLEQLTERGEDATCRARHAAYYATLGDQTESHLLREVDLAWLDLLETEHDNLRAALACMLAQGAEPDLKVLGLRLASSLWLFWYYHSHLTEGRYWLEQALSVSDPTQDAARAKAMVGLGTLTHAQGDEERSLDLLSQGLALLHLLGDRWTTAFALSVRGNLAEDAGKYDEAREFFAEANALFADLHDQVNVAVTLYHLGVVAFGQDALELADERFQRALVLSRQSHDPWTAASSLAYLGLTHAVRGELSPAAEALSEALALYQQIGSIERLADMLCRVSVLAVARRERETALRLLAAAGKIGDRIGVVRALPERAVYEHLLTELKQTYAVDEFDAAWRTGEALSTEQAIEDAVALLAMKPAAQRSHGDVVLTPSGLTPRELEILRKMAEGRSNQEIADELFISLRTVTSHVTNILAKLDLESRTAAVAFAIRDGLA